MLDDIRLGRIVWYRSKTGTYSCPAMITATADTIYQPNVDAGHMHSLSSDVHVHLAVFTAGYQGHVSEATRESNPELTDPRRRNLPAGGTYQEWDIPQWDWEAAGELAWDYSDQPAGTWAWPRKS